MQENKNLIIAVVLCLIVLFGWGHFAEYMGWVKPPVPPAPQEKTHSQAAQAPQELPQATLPAFTPAPGQDLSVETPLYKAVFYSGGGNVRSFTLKKYRSGLQADSPLVNIVDEHAAAFAPLGLVINSQPSWSTGQWRLDSPVDSLELADKKGSLRLTGVVDNLIVSRELEFDPATYLVREKISLINPGEQSRTVRLSLTTAMDKAMSSSSRYDSMRIAWDNNGSLDDEDSASTLEKSGVQTAGKIYWAGPMSTYFLFAAVPGEPEGITVKGRLAGSVYRVALEENEILLNPNEPRQLSASYWIGPKDRKMLEAAYPPLVTSIDLGFFGWIGKALIWLLELFYGYVHNWGVAIILLTFFIKAVFWPLSNKSYSSMEKMKELQPMTKALQEKYKGNREELNKEVMALYRRYNVNPLSGCMPLLLQMPVFFGLYQALLSSLALRHASFIPYLPGTHILWLADLSAPDPLYISPIVMGLTMFIQQRMSPPPADPMQQKIMMFLPLIFTVVFLSFPSGLVLYWLVTNILTILQQWLVIRKTRRGKAAAQAQAQTPAKSDGKTVIDVKAAPKKAKK